MCRLLRVAVVAGLVAAITAAQSKPSAAEGEPASRPASRPIWMEDPDDRYVKLLAGRQLEDGKGFPGVAAIGDRLGDAMKQLGNGREEPEDWPFWYFYDKGGWGLTICTNFMTKKHRRGGAEVHAVIIEGLGAPPTSKGIKVGDPVSRVVQAYGPSQRFDGALVGLDSKGKKRTAHFADRDAWTRVIEDPPEFKDALFFPAARLLVARKDDRVLKLAIVAEENSLPDFLLPQEDVPPNRWITYDESVTAPKRDEGADLGFLVPPPPELVDFKGPGYSARVPQGWGLDDDVWTDPDGVESVTIRPMKATPGESTEGALSAMIEIAGGENLIPKWRRPITASFCRLVGCTEGVCGITTAADKGKEGLPLRSYHLLLTKGTRRFLIVVTRTEHARDRETEDGARQAIAFLGCPDGDALARGVMRSIRIAP